MANEERRREKAVKKIEQAVRKAVGKGVNQKTIEDTVGQAIAKTTEKVAAKKAAVERTLAKEAPAKKAVAKKAPAKKAMDAGLKLMDTPSGWPLAVRAMGKLKPPPTTLVIVSVPLLPCTMFTDEADPMMANEGTGAGAEGWYAHTVANIWAVEKS